MYVDPDETAVAKRLTVEDIFALKVKVLGNIRRLEIVANQIQFDLEKIGAYSPYYIQDRYTTHGKDREEKEVDKDCWNYLVRFFSLEKYMLCTDYKKMIEEINSYKTPVFTVENANAWIAGLKDLINENVRVLVKKVFAEITDGAYYVGNGFRGEKKKRNNNGVDKMFILYTRDYQSVFGYGYDPTVTDDLEKVCYILAGKQIPEKTAKDQMRIAKSSEYENEFFGLKLCKNGNTHYTISDDVREKLNRYGPEGAIIGENIKIKILER